MERPTKIERSQPPKYEINIKDLLMQYRVGTEWLNALATGNGFANISYLFNFFKEASEENK